MMAELTFITSVPNEPDNYELPHIGKPGRILFEIIHVHPERWPRGRHYETYRYVLEVLDYDGESGVYWLNEGVGFDFWFDGHVDLEEPGFYVLEGVAGSWIRGDGWMTDDDEEWEFALCRRATATEIATGVLDNKGE